MIRDGRFEQPSCAISMQETQVGSLADTATAARLGPVTHHPTSLRQFLRTVVRPAIYGRCAPLEVSAHHLRGEPIPAIEAAGRPFTPFEVGDAWGGMWDTTWFRFRGSIPESWAGAEVVALIHLGGDQMVGFTAEGQIWDTGLRPVQGLHHQHREFVLTPEARGDESVEFFVEAAANPIPPWHLADWPLLLPDYAGHRVTPSRQPSWRSPTGRSRDCSSICGSWRNWPQWIPTGPRRSSWCWTRRGT